MWCVLRCHSGCEKKVVEFCRRHLSEQRLFEWRLFDQQLSGQDLSGSESSGQRLFEEHLSGQEMSRQVFSAVFIFTYDRMKRYEGAWHMETGVLFPGYVFLEVNERRSFLQQDEKAALIPQEWEKFLGSMIFVPEETEEVLRKIGGKDHHLSMSVGYITDGVTHVTSGPLVGMEPSIRRIDRHKRIARVVLPAGIAGENVTAGLEIVSKS